MKVRNLIVPFSIALLIGLTACSTTSGAEADEQADQAEQAQTQKPADEHAAHHPEGKEAGSEQMADKQQMMMQMCPMQVEATTREVVKLDDAVAMDFTTTGDVRELRQRVQKMSQMHQKKHGEGGEMHGKMHQKKHGEGGEMHGKMQGKMTEEHRQMHQQMMQMMSDVTVDTEEIDGGMRMKFTPKDAAQADKLHQMMQRHVQMMAD